MVDYSAVAVEVWEQILLWTIDLPYLLDTMLDTTKDSWRNDQRYHDLGVYAASEDQRRKLRLVCHSWRAFADAHKYRWITYDPRPEGDPKKQTEALEAIQTATVHSTTPFAEQNGFTPCRTRRITLHVAGEEDMGAFRTMIDHCAMKATTLLVECTDGYEDAIFEHLMRQGDKLQNLRCLALVGPKNFLMPLRSLSRVLPKLMALTFHSTNHSPYSPRGDDFLILPDLEMLGLDFSVVDSTSLKAWHLPRLAHWNTPISPVSFDPIKILGANVTFLKIHEMKLPVLFPAEFWTWCPCLHEIWGCFSQIYLNAPVPANHPLKYVVHWPYYDLSDNVLATGAPRSNRPVLLHNLRLLPDNLELFIASGTWAHYLWTLSYRYTNNERNDIMLAMDAICTQKRMRVENEDKEPLEDFLRE